jgi:TPR repeat protein
MEKSKKKGGGTSCIRDCANCFAAEGSVQGVPVHNACARCLITFYCSKKCQKEHWKKGGHKLRCVAVEERKHSELHIPDATGNLAGADAAEDDCAICLEPFARSLTMRLPCGHMYHANCLAEMRVFGVKQACPLCRAEIAKNPEEGPQSIYDEAMQRWVALCTREGRVGDQRGHWLPSSKADQRKAKGVLQRVEDAANQGLVIAQYNLGIIYSNGRGVPQNITKAVEMFGKAARMGLAEAQFNYGNAFHNGRGAEQNYEEAVKWFRLSANQGDADAQLNLANAYYKGHGVPLDIPTAIEWWKKCGRQGNVSASYYLGFMYSKGRGCTENKITALEWYRRAGELGHVEAQASIGAMYAIGDGVPKNSKKAIHWLSRAARKNHGAAKNALVSICREFPEDAEEAVKTAGLA